MKEIIKNKNKYYIKYDNFYREIIATTNKECNLPGIPKSFLEEYVNKQGKIEEVNVEMEPEMDYIGEDSNGRARYVPNGEILKLDHEQNVIIQSIPKEVFSLEDMRKAFELGYDLGLELEGIHNPVDFKRLEEFINSLD